MRGWDGLMDTKMTGGGTRKVEPNDRIFSHSSYGFWRTLM
jgi:hypothetical protein